ncbi:helix-turn-helix domain-containing protein [Pseudomonas petrae]|uniref:Helix-turn-helix domain-containing protein n=1 Tax=Pseudomonas petrae TaxID=2912190 RepID=A0ABS9I2E8_9PSED|nr:helix-turn-helix transcriptional regulator [Pseudomonas petrae]MCF7535153.1 helix-turn-helix domain-containing protein [Pseudomonas petrae]MCF7539868.1 helix-turn-helix domain-containing protein [Pseudomonas petrae]MCF7541354.1 helix-turn-helix domain-containing protein [Pseudomonas petrae]MCF7558314.1 helix-turn-helix domain-containing protein [Pseudomonas petrae]
MNDEIRQRGIILDELRNQLLDGTVSMGAAVKRLRTEITGLRQEQFARMCKISLRTLRQIEQDEGNPTVQTLNAVFRPFGMQVGIIPLRRRPAATSI